MAEDQLETEEKEEMLKVEGETFSWRNILSLQVRHQGFVGICVLHAVLGVVEARIEKMTGVQVALSLEYLKDGLLRDGLISRKNLGEAGEEDDEEEKILNIYGVLEWVRENPLVSEDDYVDLESLTEETKRYRIRGWRPYNDSKDREFLANVFEEMFDHGPVIADFRVCDDYSDHDEVYVAEKDPEVDPEFDMTVFHAVVLIGLGVKNGLDYFEYLNSHGPDFGSEGYGKIGIEVIDSVYGPFIEFD